jgi:hypothetical protein
MVEAMEDRRVPVRECCSSLLPVVDRSLERRLVRPLTRTLGRRLEALSGRATIRVPRRPAPPAG